jgi:anti-anti-sigma factor
MPLTVRVEEGGEQRKTLVLQGRLDNESAPAFEQQLEAVLAAPLQTLVFDLAGLEYTTSAGLRSFFRAQKAMKARGGRALVLRPQPPIQKVFDIVKALEGSSIFRSVEELDRYLDAMQRKAGAGE